jgi:hypothetical protein
MGAAGPNVITLADAEAGIRAGADTLDRENLEASRRGWVGRRPSRELTAETATSGRRHRTLSNWVCSHCSD